MVGAMLVSSVSTVWGDLEIPPYASALRPADYTGRGVRLERGDEMGRFNMGSTVIVLLPVDGPRLDAGIRPEQVVKVGQRLGGMHVS
jgi:phosphatidylserine decarboxylase